MGTAMALRYTGIRVTDLDRSLRFYCEGLGLREMGRGRMSHGGQFVGLEDPETHVELELNLYPADSPYATPYSVGEGLDHLGFVVPDARAAIERLRAMGARVAKEPWHEGGRYWIGFVEDPDGIWIEIQDTAVEGAGPTGPSGSS
jgi:lactoylglutathione lyase